MAKLSRNNRSFHFSETIRNEETSYLISRTRSYKIVLPINPPYQSSQIHLIRFITDTQIPPPPPPRHPTLVDAPVILHPTLVDATHIRELIGKEIQIIRVCFLFIRAKKCLRTIQLLLISAYSNPLLGCLASPRMTLVDFSD